MNITIAMAGPRRTPETANRNAVRNALADKLEVLAAALRNATLVPIEHFADNENENFSVLSLHAMGQNRVQFPVYLFIERAARDDDF